MSAIELGNQPAVAVVDEYMEDSTEDAIPDVKSGVVTDLDARMKKPTARFSVGDQVHMSETVGGSRVRGIYQVYAVHYNRAGQYTEYQLMGLHTQALHKKGAWFRERELHMDRRG